MHEGAIPLLDLLIKHGPDTREQQTRSRRGIDFSELADANSALQQLGHVLHVAVDVGSELLRRNRAPGGAQIGSLRERSDKTAVPIAPRILSCAWSSSGGVRTRNTKCACSSSTAFQSIPASE